MDNFLEIIWNFVKKSWNSKFKRKNFIKKFKRAFFLPIFEKFSLYEKLFFEFLIFKYGWIFFIFKIWHFSILLIKFWTVLLEYIFMHCKKNALWSFSWFKKCRILQYNFFYNAREIFFFCKITFFLKFMKKNLEKCKILQFNFFTFSTYIINGDFKNWKYIKFQNVFKNLPIRMLLKKFAFRLRKMYQLCFISQKFLIMQQKNKKKYISFSNSDYFIFYLLFILSFNTHLCVEIKTFVFHKIKCSRICVALANFPRLLSPDF